MNISVIACEVFRAEIEAIVPVMENPCRFQWLEMSQHDRPDELRKNLQAAIDKADVNPRVEAIVLAYGLCGNAAAGLRAGRCPLVIPRAHDCIGILLGGHATYKDVSNNHPHAYWYSSGWIRGEKVPGPDHFERMRAHYAETFEPEDVDELMAAMRSQYEAYQKALFIETGTPSTLNDLEYTRKAAGLLGWTLHTIPGDLSLLQALLLQQWDNPAILIIQPGHHILFTGNDQVLTQTSQEG